MSSKLSVGKIFSLKGNENTKYYLDYGVYACGTPACGTGGVKIYSVSDMGYVLILDEKPKRVKILPANAPIGWISKYYLKDFLSDKEVGSNKQLISEICNDLSMLVSTTKNTNLQHELSNILKKAAQLKVQYHQINFL